MASLRVVVALLAFVTSVQAQEDRPGYEGPRALDERIRAGGWFEQAKYRRAEDGALQMWSCAHTGDAAQSEWVSALGEGLGRGFGSCGALGWLSLFLHGGSGLLDMTDAEFHFGALGIDATDVGLRQFLAVPQPSFDGPHGRAALLDRLLAIDVLSRRGVTTAVGELGMLARNDALPAELRERANRALATLAGKPDTLVRRRLAADSLHLPAAFDACVIVDHSRMPDMSWMTAAGRRIGALVTAAAIAAADGGFVSPPQKNGAQMLCDVVSELPFAVVQQWGNARLDHSCLVVAAKADSEMQVALTLQAVGEFEHEQWQWMTFADGARDNPQLPGKLVVEAEHVFASTDGSKGMPRPALVEKLNLLRDTGEAIRVVVPANSKLWPALAAMQMPAGQGAELRITFGDPGVVVLMVETRDEEAAEAWAAKGKEMLAAAKASFEADHGDLAKENDALARLADAVFGAAIHTKDATAFATVEVRAFTPAKARAVLESLAPSLLR